MVLLAPFLRTHTVVNICFNYARKYWNDFIAYFSFVISVLFVVKQVNIKMLLDCYRYLCSKDSIIFSLK